MTSLDATNHQNPPNLRGWNEFIWNQHSGECVAVLFLVDQMSLQSQEMDLFQEPAIFQLAASIKILQCCRRHSGCRRRLAMRMPKPLFNVQAFHNNTTTCDSNSSRTGIHTCIHQVPSVTCRDQFCLSIHIAFPRKNNLAAAKKLKTMLCRRKLAMRLCHTHTQTKLGNHSVIAIAVDWKRLLSSEN